MPKSISHRLGSTRTVRTWGTRMDGRLNKPVGMEGRPLINTTGEQRELEACKKEIVRLKDLVIRLSELVIRNVVQNSKKNK